MLKKLSSSIPLLLLSAVLAGCDSIPFLDNDSDYKTAGRGRPLEVPPDLTSTNTDDAFSVPGTTTLSSFNQQNQANQTVEEKLLPSAEGVKLERAGSQRWLIVPAPPEKVWPVIRAFWIDLGFPVRVENIQTGVIETDWVTVSEIIKDGQGNVLSRFQGWLDRLSALNNRQKFRTRIDRNADENVTEIYISHRSLGNEFDDGKERVLTPFGLFETGFKTEDTKKNDAEDDDIDAEFLRRLVVKLGIAEKQSHNIIDNPVEEKHASTSTDKDGIITLTVNDAFDRSWRRVGLALDRIGFLIEDRDRSRGLYFVRYSDLDADKPSEDKKGLLDKLKFWGDSSEKEKQPEPEPEQKKDDKGIIDKLKFWETSDKGKEKSNGVPQYRIHLERGETTTTVTVVGKDGKQVKSRAANRIMTLLYEQLQ